MSIKRYAMVRGNMVDPRTVASYLPSNYQVDGTATATEPWGKEYPVVVICGRDKGGWTLDGYVIPRLGSGNLVAVEIDLSHPVMKQIPDGPNRVVTVFVEGGLVQDVDVPDGVTVTIKDRDVEGICNAEPERYKEDVDGDYVESVYGEGEDEVGVDVQGGVASVTFCPDGIDVIVEDSDES